MKLFLPKLTPLLILLCTVASWAQGGRFRKSEYVRGMDTLSADQAAFMPLAILLGIVVTVIIFVNPVFGIVITMVFFPFLGSTSGISMVELVAAMMLLGFVGAWVARRADGRRTGKDYGLAERYFVLFAGYLVLNCGIAYFNRIPVIDIIRDMVPVANLVIFLVCKRFVRTQKELDLIVKAQLVIVGVLVVRDVLLSTTHNNLFYQILPASGSNLGTLLLLVTSVAMLMAKKSTKAIWIVGVLATGIIFILTTNRTIFLAALCSVLMVIFLMRKSGRMLGVAIGLVLFFGVLYVAAERMRQPDIAKKEARLLSATGSKDVSILSRFDEARQCWVIFLKNPATGVGIGHRYIFWRHFVAGIGAGWMEDNFTHSDIMFLLSKTGIIGTVLYCLFYITLCRLAFLVYKKAPREQDRLRGLVVFVTLIVGALVGQSTPILQTRSTSILLGLIMGYTFCLYRLVFAPAPKPRVRSVPISAPVARDW